MKNELYKEKLQSGVVNQVEVKSANNKPPLPLTPRPIYNRQPPPPPPVTAVDTLVDVDEDEDEDSDDESRELHQEWFVIWCVNVLTYKHCYSSHAKLRW